MVLYSHYTRIMVMQKTKLIGKIFIQSLLNKQDFKNPNPKRLFAVAVMDEKNNYQGYRLITDQIPENWNLHKVENQLSMIPIVTGG